MEEWGGREAQASHRSAFGEAMADRCTRIGTDVRHPSALLGSTSLTAGRVNEEHEGHEVDWGIVTVELAGGRRY